MPGLVAVLFSLCLMKDRSSALTRPSCVASPRSTLTRKLKSPPTGLELGDLSIRGINNPTITPTAFNYDAATKTAVWTLPAAVTNDKLRFVLGAAGVANLDGEWANASATESYPSGNGTVGGDFDFRVNVLRGDATQDGRVNALDLSFIKQRLNKTATNPGVGAGSYSVFADLDANGAINALDLAAARGRLNTANPVA